MDTAAMQKLALGLRRQARWADLKLRADVKEDRIVFSGGQQGSHSLDVAASSRARVLAHWEGYCEQNGMPGPEVGQQISFVGTNGCLYRGLVEAVGPKRVRMTFRYRNGNAGRANVALEDLRFYVRI